MIFTRFLNLLSGCGPTSYDGRGVSPNQPRTRKHGVRIDDELWEAALKKAHDEGLTLTEVIIRALRLYLRD